MGWSNLNDRKCPICGEFFTPEYPNSRYCCDEHSKEGLRLALKKADEKRREKKERKMYLAEYMFINGHKYRVDKHDLGSKYTNGGSHLKLKYNRDGTKNFKHEAEMVRKMSYLLLGKSNMTKEDVKEMVKVDV